VLSAFFLFLFGSAPLLADRQAARQGKARQGKARQGKARQGKARQGKARQGKASALPQGSSAARWDGNHSAASIDAELGCAVTVAH